MSRPAFLTSPGAWLRSPRTIQSRVDAACAVEHNVAPAGLLERAADIGLAVALGIAAASGIWFWLAS